ncbi:hypothetical protein [Microvirga antarctica]|uniref:hypothetical protein n=1 Tax=Microvirga antarctica TaxID=2819233 RepID=UPI001B316935|nr:hypothetical protein [Microvirga antarctica]
MTLSSVRREVSPKEKAPTLTHERALKSKFTLPTDGALPAENQPKVWHRRTSDARLFGSVVMSERQRATPGSPRAAKIGRAILRQIADLVRHRGHSHEVSDDLQIYIEAALPQLSLIERAHVRGPALHDWVEETLPVLFRSRRPGWLADMKLAFDDNPYQTSMVDLGRMLRVTDSERQGLKLWQMMPVDMSPEELREQCLQRDRERKARTRAAAGAISRESSKARVKPWDDEGISRAAWYRRQRISRAGQPSGG